MTGAAGFIGARFVESCDERGIQVVSVDRTDHFEKRSEHQGIEFGEIIDRRALFQWLRQARPDLRGIVHLGACARTTVTDRDFLDQWNLLYSQQIWDYACDHDLPLVYASSAATYGDGAKGFDDREDRIATLEPLNAYADSKHRFDLWVLEQERLGRTPPAWCGLKLFNVYGFGERHKNDQASVVLQAFDQIERSGRVRLFESHREDVADGHQMRDFVWVGDVTEAIHFALARPVRRGIFNLGTGTARTFRALALAVFEACGKPARIEFVPTPAALRAPNQDWTQAGMDRLRAEGLTRPATSLEIGVEETVARLRDAPGSTRRNA